MLIKVLQITFFKKRKTITLAPSSAVVLFISEKLEKATQEVCLFCKIWENIQNQSMEYLRGLG